MSTALNLRNEELMQDKLSGPQQYHRINTFSSASSNGSWPFTLETEFNLEGISLNNLSLPNAFPWRSSQVYQDMTYRDLMTNQFTITPTRSFYSLENFISFLNVKPNLTIVSIGDGHYSVTFDLETTIPDVPFWRKFGFTKTAHARNSIVQITPVYLEYQRNISLRVEGEIDTSLGTSSTLAMVSYGLIHIHSNTPFMNGLVNNPLTVKFNKFQRITQFSMYFHDEDWDVRVQQQDMDFPVSWTVNINLLLSSGALTTHTNSVIHP